ncbi:MAG: hypothetical protein O9295_12155 [Microcystis sp. LE18-22.4A]|nr:hypothetical protein [Microcystis sp. LE18-22.4A]
MTPSKSVKPHTPHPTPYTLLLGKTFSANPMYGGSPVIQQTLSKRKKRSEKNHSY